MQGREQESRGEADVIILVLMGGASSEREISLKSGEAVRGGLERAGHRVTTFDYNPAQDRGAGQLLASASLREADLVFLALHGGEGEDGRMQALLDLAGKAYTGSGVRASSVCMDKAITKIMLEKACIETPAWARLARRDAGAWRSNPEIRQLGFPVVVKPLDQGSTIGISIVKMESDLEGAIALALEYSSDLIFEKYIDGREMSVSIVGEEVFPIVEIKPRHGFYDYERKYTKGMTDYECPARIESGLARKIESDALSGYLACGCEGFARVDLRLGPDGVAYFLEINTIPGMTETSLVPMAAKAKGLTFEALVDRIASLGLGRARPASPKAV
jgi:D-alanine-D-alanine ligase